MMATNENDNDFVNSIKVKELTEELNIHKTRLLLLKNALSSNPEKIDMQFEWRFYVDRLRDLQNRNRCIAVSLRQRLDRAKLVPITDRTSRYFEAGEFKESLDETPFDLKHFRKLRDEFQSRCSVYQEKLNRLNTSMSREVESNRNLFLKRSEDRLERAFMVKDLRDDNTAKFSEIEAKRTQLTGMKMAYEKVFSELVAMHAEELDVNISSNDGMRRNLIKLLMEHKDLVHQQIFMKKQLHLFEVRLKATKIELARSRKRFESVLADQVPMDDSLTAVGFVGDMHQTDPLHNEFESSFMTQITSDGVPAANMYMKLLVEKQGSAEVSAQRSRILHLLGREFYAHWKDAQTMFSLSEALQHMATLQDIDRAVQFVMRAVCKLTECDRSSYWVIDKAKGIAWTKVNTFGGDKKNEDENNLGGLTTLMVPINSGLVGAAFNSGKVLNIPDAYADTRFNRQVDMRTEYRTKSVLCYPIVYQGQVVGVTQCINKISPSASIFSNADLAIVQALGNAMLSVLSSCHAHEEANKQTVRRNVLVSAVEEMVLSMSNRRDFLALTRSKFKQLFKSNDFHIVLVYKDFYAKVLLDDGGAQISMVDADREDDHGGLIHDCAQKQVPVHLFGQAALGPFAHKLGKADSDFLKTGCLEVKKITSDVSVHSWPIFSKSRPDQVSAVLQWVCLDRSVIGFGDDGTFNEFNPVHVDLAAKFVNFVGFFIERFWPSKYRLVWNKAKHLQLKVRGLVAFSFATKKSSEKTPVVRKLGVAPPQNRKVIDLWKRAKNWARDSMKFKPASPLVEPMPAPVVRSIPVAGNFMEKLRQEEQASLAKRKSVMVATASPEELANVTKAAWTQRKSLLLFADVQALAALVDEQAAEQSSESSDNSSSSDDDELSNDDEPTEEEQVNSKELTRDDLREEEPVFEAVESSVNDELLHDESVIDAVESAVNELLQDEPGFAGVQPNGEELFPEEPVIELVEPALETVEAVVSDELLQQESAPLVQEEPGL